MNNRGKVLSHLELLKNRLIYLSLKFKQPDYEKNQLRKSINDSWKAIYHYLGKNKDNPLDDDRFLSNHFIVYFGKDAITSDESPRFLRRLGRMDYSEYLLENKFIPKNVQDDAEPKEKITVSEIYDYVTSLQICVELWYKIFNPFDSDFSPSCKLLLDKVNRQDFTYFAPLAMVFFQNETIEAKRILFLQALERNLFIFSLISYRFHHPMYRTEESMLWAIELSKGKINTDKIIKNIQETTKKIIDSNEFRKEMIALFRSNGFYAWDGIRYFLYEYNLSLQESSKTSRAKIFWPEFNEPESDFVTVEHIYPQRPRNHYWTTLYAKHSDKERTALRHSLGNLLPLSSPKNSSLQNNTFPEKVDGKGERCIGFRYGCYAENEVGKLKSWTSKDILERGIKLLDFMEKRWNLTLGTNKDKAHLLNLDFLVKDDEKKS